MVGQQLVRNSPIIWKFNIFGQRNQTLICKIKSFTDSAEFKSAFSQFVKRKI